MNSRDTEQQPEWPASMRSLVTAALQLGLPLPPASLSSSPTSPQHQSAPARLRCEASGKSGSPESHHRAHSGPQSPAASAQEQEAEYWRQRRRMTNRESAQRVRRKKQASAQEAHQQVEQLRQAQGQLQQAHAGACQLVGQLRGQVAHWQGRAQSLQGELGSLQGEVGALKRRLALAENQLGAGPSAPVRQEPTFWPAPEGPLGLEALPSLSSASRSTPPPPAGGALGQLPGSFTSDLTSLDLPAPGKGEEAMLQLADDLFTGACFEGLGELEDWDTVLDPGLP